MKLWKNNKLSNEWELPDEEIATRFLASKWNDYPWTIDRALPVFIGHQEGLSSSFEPDDPAYVRVIKLILDGRRAADGRD